MEAKFYEMLETATTFDKWSSLINVADLFHRILKKEIEIAQFTPTSSRVSSLLLHMLELEREILKARLEEILESFDNPRPPAHNF